MKIHLERKIKNSSTGNDQEILSVDLNQKRRRWLIGKSSWIFSVKTERFIIVLQALSKGHWLKIKEHRNCSMLRQKVRRTNWQMTFLCDERGNNEKKSTRFWLKIMTRKPLNEDGKKSTFARPQATFHIKKYLKKSIRMNHEQNIAIRMSDHYYYPIWISVSIYSEKKGYWSEGRVWLWHKEPLALEHKLNGKREILDKLNLTNTNQSNNLIESEGSLDQLTKESFSLSIFSLLFDIFARVFSSKMKACVTCDTFHIHFNY